MRAHFLHDIGKGIEADPKTSDPSERRKYEVEKEEANKLKRRHDQLANASIEPQTPSQGLCLRQGRGKHLNKQYNHQKIPKGVPQFKRAE